ncbi:MAG: hypothetical protein GF317_21345, partial [Candidatus Lokiarchaeota archaeon]|nr:hypothetical protein [Candidatus Lokiarchaeota archaeon]MBD3202002.1 hypothetical protein [Candidatus Lokiarchaeota archaeon]
MIFDLPIISKLREVLTNLASFPAFFFSVYILIPITLIVSVLCLIFIFRKINSLEEKTVKMREINSDIVDGAKVYLRDQAKTLLTVLAILFIPVGFTGIDYLGTDLLSRTIGFLLTSLIFLLGSLSSLVAGYIGMKAATKTNILVVEASFDDPNQGFRLAYFGGMITGILNISMFVFGIWLILIITNGNAYLMVGYNFGASV